MGSDEDLYDYAWDMVLKHQVYIVTKHGAGDYDNEVVYHDCIINESLHTTIDRRRD